MWTIEYYSAIASVTLNDLWKSVRLLILCWLLEWSEACYLTHLMLYCIL